MNYFDQLENTYEEGDYKYPRLLIETTNFYEDKTDTSIYWRLLPLHSIDGTHLGHIFMRKECGYYSHPDISTFNNL